MKKSLIALAVLAGVAGTANADTTLYGRLDVAYELYDKFYKDAKHDGNKNVRDISEDKWNSAITGYGRVGVKGHEDLGNGLQAIYKFEFGYDIGNIRNEDTYKAEVKDGKVELAKSNPHGRYAWVGLKGKSWGQLTFGTQLTAIGDLAGWWGLTTNALDHWYLDDKHWLAYNSVRYVSPEFNGLQFQATVSMDGKGITSGECAKTTKKSDGKDVPEYCAVTNRNHTDLWSVGVSYANNGFEAILAYANRVDVSQGLTTSIGYGNKQFAVGINADWREDDYSYKIVENGAGVEIDDGKETWSVSLNGLYNISKMDSIRAAIGTKGTIDDDDELSDDNPYFVSLSFRHKFSKRTFLNAGYTFTDQNEKGDDEATTSHKLKVGIRHYF